MFLYFKISVDRSINLIYYVILIIWHSFKQTEQSCLIPGRLNKHMQQVQKKISLNPIIFEQTQDKTNNNNLIQNKLQDRVQQRKCDMQNKQGDQTIQTIHSKRSFIKKLPSLVQSAQLGNQKAEDPNAQQNYFIQSVSKPFLRNSKHVSGGIYNIQEKAYSRFFQKQSIITYSGKLFVKVGDNFVQQQSSIRDKIFTIGNRKIPIEQITKVKCLLQPISQGALQTKIKVVINQNQQCFIAASIQNKIEGQLNQHYTWFCKIVYNKVQSIKNQLSFGKYQQLKEIFKQNNQNKSNFQKNEKIKVKLDIQEQNFLCKGTIYKKSKYLKTWQTRYLVITQRQLFSFINATDNFTFHLKSEDIKYIWSRFDVYNGYLIIKIKHSLQQTQFAIPITNYFEKVNENWLWAFYRLLAFSAKSQPNN